MIRCLLRFLIGALQRRVYFQRLAACSRRAHSSFDAPLRSRALILLHHRRGCFHFRVSDPVRHGRQRHRGIATTVPCVVRSSVRSVLDGFVSCVGRFNDGSMPGALFFSSRLSKSRASRPGFRVPVRQTYGIRTHRQPSGRIVSGVNDSPDHFQKRPASSMDRHPDSRTAHVFHPCVR